MRPILALLLLAAPALADSRGPLRVIDGDTFDVGGVRVRLHGVDAPEHDQSCLDATGAEWPCGAWAAEAARRAWEGRDATCARTDTDRYGREVSRCSVAGVDLGEALVEAGVATAYRAYSEDYVLAEGHAKSLRAGIWAGEIEPPADWRAERRAEAAEATAPAPGACPIKGNVSSGGRIYHLPGSRSYAGTRIDEGAGERWFCSEAEARAAGWRAARG